jgi:hypothetical protein
MEAGMENEEIVEYEALPLRYAYDFLANNGLQSEAEDIRTSKEKFGSYTTTLKRAKIVALLSSKGLLDKFVAEYWPHGATENRREIKRLNRIYSRWSDPGTGPEDEQDDDEAGTEFVLEEHLRDYLAQNLHVLEHGMALWQSGANQESVEFVIDSDKRRIDILAKDQHGIPTVVELKVSRGHEKTIGQALYYRARVKQLFNAPKVRIVIVAGEISPELKAAASDLQDVSLFEYSLSMSVKKV